MSKKRLLHAVMLPALFGSVLFWPGLAMWRILYILFISFTRRFIYMYLCNIFYLCAVCLLLKMPINKVHLSFVQRFICKVFALCSTTDPRCDTVI